MDARAFDKSKLPSRHVTEGPSRAPHRSYYYAMGLTEEQIHRPFAGVVSCWNEAAPCNIALMRQAQSAKKGVGEAGGGGYLHGDWITVTGKALAQSLENVKFNENQKVVFSVSKAISTTGGGSIALVKNGDIIAIDAVKSTLEVEAAELDKCRKAWKAPANPYQSGVLRKYADQVGPARNGAVTHAGGKAEVVCYADI